VSFSGKEGGGFFAYNSRDGNDFDGGGICCPPALLYRQQNVGAVHAAVDAHMPVQISGLREPE